MPTKYKRDLISRKRRLKNIYKYNAQFKVSPNYLVVTDDYEQSEIDIPIANLTKQVPVNFKNDINKTVQNTPLWDWFTIANLKKNKIWYCDFSMPYYQKKASHDPHFISKMWAESEIPMKLSQSVLSHKMFELHILQDIQLVDERTKFYLENNNWDQTLSTFDAENESKKNWNRDTPLVYANEKHDIGIVIPYSFTNLSIAECFNKAIESFFSGKQDNPKQAHNLIAETQYKIFLK